jgi:hypothetical protein
VQYGSEGDHEEEEQTGRVSVPDRAGPVHKAARIARFRHHCDPPPEQYGDRQDNDQGPNVKGLSSDWLIKCIQPLWHSSGRPPRFNCGRHNPHRQKDEML